MERRDPHEGFKNSLQYWHNSLRMEMKTLIEVLLASKENITYSDLKVCASLVNAV